MNKIDARSKTIRELLEKTKYSIDFYQREYKWKKEHVTALLDDLEAKFLSEYEEGHEPQKVQQYAHYFLGPIIISRKNSTNSIVDGQQRLTTLTLLLIYLNNLQTELKLADSSLRTVEIKSLVFSEKFGAKSFNIDVDERATCMEALFNNSTFNPEGVTESVRNITDRFNDIVQLFPEPLKNHVLPFFIDWLIECVDLVEVVAYSDDDAYAIFETMNDRGLRLSSAEMLKGYLLANISDDNQKQQANELWRKRTFQFLELADGDEKEAEEFFKDWLRSQYAESIRERKKDAKNEDWESLGTRYHKWVRDEHKKLKLNNSKDFLDFIIGNFDFYSMISMKIWKAGLELTPGLEYVYYNSENNFTLQDVLILAAITPNDDEVTIEKKIRLVAGYIDIFITRRVVNFRTLSYSSIVYTMFNLMKEIRHKPIKELSQLLKQKVTTMEESFNGVRDFYMHQQNRAYVHMLLARMTQHIAEKCGIDSHILSYLDRSIKHPCQVEHIWANDYDQYKTEFSNQYEFGDYRNRFGGLILLPDDFNKSYGKKGYKEKLDGYLGQNVLAKTLHPKWYQNNPSFISYKDTSGLPFKPYPDAFIKVSLDERQELYRLLCEEIWSPNRFDLEIV
ncbi:DUF262 domain-containing protein [Dehalococcoides mccartyi]|uniref:DUF262 domain-containing protein n=1 Tax=Dehalococcoides mccartyi TaxID=61435 RepID=UPI002FC75D8F